MNSIRWRVNSNGLEFYAPNRKWVPIVTEEDGKNFLTILQNVTKNYPEQKGV